jgi:superfamily II DNA or RNA helicase
LILSPTASGKSLVVYLISRFYAPKGKVLVVVPTVSLVHQMASDFVEYGCDPSMVHKILAGSEKTSDTGIVISTWQSIFKLHKPWFQQFTTVIGDEAHLFKAKSLTSIMDKMSHCRYRFGLTGTLDGTQTHKLVLEGIFGSVYKATTTAELISQNHLASFKIKAITLDYDEATRKAAKSFNYQSEVDFLINHEARNRFLSKLVHSLKGNTLLLFNNIAHGKVLAGLIRQLRPDSDVFLVYGDVKGEEREDIRSHTESNNNVVIVASYGTFSTGVNIKNLHNVILGSPSKSRIRVLQSIGRGLRKGTNKQSAVWYDIADDLSWKSTKNFTLEHMVERLKMYNSEQFDYTMYTVQMRS